MHSGIKKLIHCDTCNVEYESLFEVALGQAMHCSSSIFVVDDGRMMMGYYGSLVADGQLFKVLTDDLKTGIVCDDCIEKYILTGGLKLISKDNYFGNIEI
jgi:hypothetical protein